MKSRVLLSSLISLFYDRMYVLSFMLNIFVYLDKEVEIESNLKQLVPNFNKLSSDEIRQSKSSGSSSYLAGTVWQLRIASPFAFIELTSKQLALMPSGSFSALNYETSGKD